MFLVNVLIKASMLCMQPCEEELILIVDNYIKIDDKPFQQHVHSLIINNETTQFC
jgi:hypothetical protein